MKDGDIGGAVYVYINQAGKWEKVTPVCLNGTKDSMFGLAVENIGDINQDSYEGLVLIVYLDLIDLFCVGHHQINWVCFSRRHRCGSSL